MPSHPAWIVLATLIVVAVVNLIAWTVLRSQGMQLVVVRTQGTPS